MGSQVLEKFYSCTIGSILTGCIIAWYGNCSASDRKVLQRVVHTVQYIYWDPSFVPSRTYIICGVRGKPIKLSERLQSPTFSLLPHNKRYRSAKSWNKRLLNSFYAQVRRLMNN